MRKRPHPTPQASADRPSDPAAASRYARAMDANEPRPCPFCAHAHIEIREVTVQGTRVFVVVCPECNAMGPVSLAGETADDALYRWNLRFGNH